MATVTREHLALSVAVLEAARARQGTAADWTPLAHQHPPPGDWATWLLLAGRGAGKRLALDTPLPTADGWTTMGEVAVGDVLFDERGEPCLVTYVSPIALGDSWRVTFTDGESIVADAEHRWVTWDHAARKNAARRVAEPNASWVRRVQCQPRALPAVRTTAGIRATLVYAGRERNHAIATTSALDLPACDLPIPPYTLGVWLGDGNSQYGNVTAAPAGEAVLAGMTAEGYQVTAHTIQPARTPSFGVLGLQAQLRAAGLLGHKHVPSVYLRASVAQRLLLLQGLMDTDGGWSTSQAEFVSTTEALADAVAELVVSLGMKATRNHRPGRFGGREYRTAYRVTFTPTLPVFTVPYKAARQRFDTAQQQRRRYRYVDSVEAVPAVPMRCIAVDSPSHLYLAGRGMIPTHNTEAMARYCAHHLRALGPAARVGVGAPTIAAVRDIAAEGVSGLVTLHPGEFTYNRSLGEARHTGGGYVKFLGSEEPGRWNGPQWTLLWWDELALCNVKAFEQSLFGLRLGTDPRLVASTTPKGANFVKALSEEPGTVTTRATTADNPHLAAVAVARLASKYAGTRLGRQELLGEWLDDVEGALWLRAWFDERRAVPDLQRIVVAVDPAASATEASDETGIVVAGKGVDGLAYILADRSCRLSPDGWARRAIAAFDEFGADRVVVEANNGGDMVSHTLKTIRPTLPITVVHASRGKQARAEPVAALYEQGRVWHTQAFPELEDQLCSWTVESGQSPDRLDALVWALTELFLQPPPARWGAV